MAIFEDWDSRDGSSVVTDSKNRPSVPQPTTFRAQLEVDSQQVFLNLMEFGEERTLRVDGEVYEKVAVILDEGVTVPHKNYKVMKTDYSKGLMKDTVRLYCLRSDLGGRKPEVDEVMEIESDKRRGFWHKYTVEESRCEEGMLTLLLKKVDE